MHSLKRYLTLIGITLLSAYPFAAFSLLQYRLWQNGLRGTWLDFVFYILSLFFLLFFGEALRRFGKYSLLVSTIVSLAGLALGLGLLYLLLPVVA